MSEILQSTNSPIAPSSTIVPPSPTSPTTSRTSVGRVQVLPRSVAEKIAAGEVIERPFSIVKELVENALDASATQLTIELENGGMRSTSVTDNGCGLDENDVLTALERHATSKITSVDDLWALNTLGFRGEALPSIAAISQFTIETRRLGQKGRHVMIEGGILKTDKILSANSQVPYPSGTRMTAEHIFFNVPARLKFLKAKSSEASAVRDLIERIALTHPHVGFSLISDGRKTLQLTATKTIEERFSAVIDTPIDSLVPITAQYDEIRLNGWLDIDGRANNSRKIFLAVNGRMVKDKLLLQAVTLALRPFMMEGEYPRIYLHVHVPPTELDVNVHPTKTEVRFTKPKDVFSLIKSASEHASAKSNKIAYNIRFAPNSELAHSKGELSHTQSFYAAQDIYKNQASVPPNTGQQNLSNTTNSVVFQKKSTSFSASVLTPAIPVNGLQTEVPTENTLQITKSLLQTLPFIGQVKNTYLLFQDHDGLVIVDQHAAHERINYEQLKQHFYANGLRPQPLLIGATIKASPETIAFAIDHQPLLEKLGFEYEPFGENHLIIRSIPQDLDDKRALECFNAVLDELKATDGDLPNSDLTRLAPKIERLISTTACHSSIRAGQALSPREASELFSQMVRTSSLNCPHGRPASVKLTHAQLEGLFKRT